MLSVFKKHFPKSYAPVFDLVRAGQKEKAISFLPSIEANLVRLAQKNSQLWDSLFYVASKDTSEIAPSPLVAKNLLHVYLAAPYGSYNERQAWNQMTKEFSVYFDRGAKEKGWPVQKKDSFDLALPAKAPRSIPDAPYEPKPVVLRALLVAHPA